MDIKNYIKKKSLFELAMTHRSWLNENGKVGESNERLEFLGDAVLEFVVSSFLYNSFTDKEEGYLTALRAKLVNTQSLAKVGSDLEIGNYLRLSKGEEESGGRRSESLLANTVEALIGAIYIESGIEKANEFIMNHIIPYINEYLSQPLKDHKSRLQEYIQSRGLDTPKYVVVDETGKDHEKIFTIQVVVGNKKYESGSGKSKSLAEQEAAQNTLLSLGVEKRI